MKVKDYMNQTNIMVLDHLPKYAYGISVLNSDENGEVSMLLSFSLAHPDLLNGSKLTKKEMIDIAGEQDVIGQVAISESVLNDVMNAMKGK
jgi:hypothetical protein